MHGKINATQLRGSSLHAVGSRDEMNYPEIARRLDRPANSQSLKRALSSSHSTVVALVLAALRRSPLMGNDQNCIALMDAKYDLDVIFRLRYILAVNILKPKDCHDL
jgi:hypothetical protein